MTEKDVQDIQRVIEEAYIRGIHETQNRSLIDRGFHPSFEMLVLEDDGTLWTLVHR